MCGIFGYIGRNGSVNLLLEGLKRLEYRGYDSAGIAFLNSTRLSLYKTRGKISDLEDLLPSTERQINIGIAHTRWATHGVPSTENAHPHAVDGIAVVHNGIIENFRQLRQKLLSVGCSFSSETDTEVVPHLIALNLKKGLSMEEAIRAAISELQGSFALGILSERTPDTLYAVRNGSPLVIGVDGDNYFFASDIPAVLPYTKHFLILEDGDFCKLNCRGVEIYNLYEKRLVEPGHRMTVIDIPASQAEKCGYEHFMLKEIFEQPGAVMNTLGEWMDDPLSILDELHLSIRDMIDIERVQIVACGTSYYAGLVGRYIIETLARIPVDIDIASEYRYRNPIIKKKTLFISITQSGETADTLAAQREAKSRNAHVLTICNVVGSTAAREADSVIYTRAGPEIGVASTKSFTTQLAALSVFAIAVGMKRGILSREEFDSLKRHLMKVPEAMEKVLRLDGWIKEISGNFINARDFLFLGRGINYPIAMEGALKLKEISYIHAEGYPAGEMKHGPIALVEDGVPVVFVCPVDALFVKTLSNIEEVRARGGRVIAVTDDPECLRDKAEIVMTVPSIHSLLSPFVTVIPLQLLAYHIAVLRGHNVDQPRNLAKSVTVE